MPKISLSLRSSRICHFLVITTLYVLCCSLRVYAQPLSDTLKGFSPNRSFEKAYWQKMDNFLFNTQAYSATLIHNRKLFTINKRVIGAGIGSEVMFNSHSAFVPGQQAFRPIQGMPVYPQYIPVAVRPGISIFNSKNNAATLLQVGNLMEGRQGLTSGQIQIGKMWRIN
ncbi:MAG: hypothetical protein MUF24_10740 [Chitinophagaceae bacterium]|jgi:hypothetical protein|nr:hypothetical protein [Chitinophagaceae bacterium]